MPADSTNWKFTHTYCIMDRKNGGAEISRRDFLKNMGRLTGGVTLLAATPWLTFCTPEKHREIAGERARVALIGTGSRGQYHLHNLRAIPHAEVVALCDDYEPNLRTAQRLSLIHISAVRPVWSLTANILTIRRPKRVGRWFLRQDSLKRDKIFLFLKRFVLFCL